MGVELGVALAGAMLTSDVVSMDAQSSAITAEQSSLKLEAAQQNLKFAQKTANNITATRRSMETQAVAAAGQDESLASPTLKAITLNTFQTGKKTQQNIDLENKAAQISYQNKEDALSSEKSALPYELVGKVAEQGADLYAARLF